MSSTPASEVYLSQRKSAKAAADTMLSPRPGAPGFKCELSFELLRSKTERSCIVIAQQPRCPASHNEVQSW